MYDMNLQHINQKEQHQDGVRTVVKKKDIFVQFGFVLFAK